MRGNGKQVYDYRHPQLSGVELGPGSKPIYNGSWSREVEEHDFCSAALPERRRRLVLVRGRALH